MSDYPCTMCGACCRKVNVAVEFFKKIDEDYEFPYGWDETGRCEKLGEDNRCTVYETRPLLCNIDEMARVYGLDKKEFYKANIKVCNVLMDLENLDKKFRIIT